MVFELQQNNKKNFAENLFSVKITDFHSFLGKVPRFFNFDLLKVPLRSSFLLGKNTRNVKNLSIFPLQTYTKQIKHIIVKTMRSSLRSESKT